MSGWPMCASDAPSLSCTSAWTIDCGCTTTSIRSSGTPKRCIASMTSRPLFISVAESIVIFPPMSHVGWASACSRVTFFRSAALRPRNEPPLAVSTSLSIVPGRCSAFTSWNRAECSESTGITCAPVASASAMTSSPPTTSDSLLASARSIPSPRVATLGPRPAEPTSAFSTRSQSLPTISSTRPSLPASTSPPVQASAARAATASSASAIRSTPCCSAWATSRSKLEPAAMPTSSISSLRSTTSSACVPIDPVDPSSTNLRTQARIGTRLNAACGSERPEREQLAQRRGVAGLVDAERARARDAHLRHEAPALVSYAALELDALGPELLDRRLDVVAHQVELVDGDPVHGRVDRQLGGRQGEDQPAAAGVDRVEAEDVAEEGAGGVGVVRRDDVVGTGDHAAATFCAWRSGLTRTTFQASPTRSIARISRPDGSISHQRSPWLAEVGKAWWLWCQASPIDGMASQKTLRDSSSVANRRRPKKWQTELMLQVMWCSRKMRTSPPHRSPVRPPANSPVSSQP